MQGTPFRLRVRVKYKNDNGAVVPYPLDNCVVHLQARPSVSSSLVILDLSSKTTGITIGPEAGSFDLHMTSQETSALIFGQPHKWEAVPYQCEVESADGETIRALQGMLTLDPEVVR